MQNTRCPRSFPLVFSGMGFVLCLLLVWLPAAATGPVAPEFQPGDSPNSQAACHLRRDADSLLTTR